MPADPHRDMAGGERGPVGVTAAPALVESARAPVWWAAAVRPVIWTWPGDRGVLGCQGDELVEGVPVSLVAGELERPGRLSVVLRDLRADVYRRATRRRSRSALTWTSA